MFDLSAWAPLLFAAGLLILIFEVSGSRSAGARFGAAILCTAMTMRYMSWRMFHSLPTHQNLLQQLWSHLFLIVELATLSSSILVYLFMSRTVDRSAEADAHANSGHHEAPVDVFIATYNEGSDILERTMVGALSIDHADLRVWVLDDGNRPWVREMAMAMGVRYVARSKGKHAKAGNVNNGVQHALRTDRPPAFFLLLDADFIPHRNILRRTLGLFDDTSVGIVQTPQHFFNPDPVQSNLLCSAVWPDEQRFFFNCLLPSKDAWGAAFCCGTSAVFRTEAFVAADGMATETVTEDMLTTFKFQEFGFRTIFLNERLSLGLAPESMLDFISQRARWCLGAIQQLFTRWSFAGKGRISWVNRLAFFDTVLYWVSGASFKLMLVSAPLLYWFTGTAALHATTQDLLRQLAPMVVTNLLFMFYLAGNRVLPVMTDVTQLLTAFVIFRTVVTGLVRPFGRPFKVTAKGLSTSGFTVQWRLLWPYALLSGLTVLGIVFHIARFSPAHGMHGYSANIFWSVVNTAMLTLAGIACVELPHRRRDERLPTREAASVHLSGAESGGDRAESEHATLFCTLRDISLGGAALELPAGWPSSLEQGNLELFDAANNCTISAPFTVVSRRNELVSVRFAQETGLRHALIRKLFTGAYHQDVQEVSARRVLVRLFRTIVS